MTLASEGLKLPDRLHTVRYHEPEKTLPSGITVTSEPDDDEDEGELTYNDDGSVTVNGPAPKKKVAKSKFNANLAEYMDEGDLSALASELLDAIEQDKNSRKDWEETFNKGIDLLGLKIESATTDVTNGGNISKAKDPMLIEAVLRYQSNFNAEMLPANGPVKVRDDKKNITPVAPPSAMGAASGSPMLGHNGGPPMGGAPDAPPVPELSRSELAEAFEKDFNHYLTVIDKAYYADTDRMSFSQALGGCAFKKIYMDPIEERPLSRFVMATHLIVNNGASSLHDAKRITHHIPNFSQVEMEKMMLAGAYRDVELSLPVSEADPVDAKIKETEGIKTNVDRPEDRDYTVFECYCYLNLAGFEQKNDRRVPYRVTIEKDSRIILEIRRNWKEKDKNFKPRRRFVKYPLFPGLGFYDYGYVHILGNTTRVLSAIESLMVDQGMFANFPGGMIDKMAAKQETNQIRPGPGGFKPIDTGGRPINQVVMPMPYRDVSANMMALAKGIQEGGQKLGSIAELPLGEGRADVPVGTMIAMIEQSTKLLSAVHKRNHSAQQEEFEILKELFLENPAALVNLAEDPAHQWEEAAEFKDINLTPASDPNIASHLMRVMRATAVLQIVQQAPPGLMNAKEAIKRALMVMGEEDVEELFNPPPDPASQPPPPHVIDAQAKQAALAQQAQQDKEDNAMKMQEMQLELQDHAADRQNKLDIQQSKLQQQAMKDAQEFQRGITPPNSLAPGAMGGRPVPEP